VYLDAVVPQDGQSLFDVAATAMGRAAIEGIIAQALGAGDGWRLPLRNPPDPRLTPQPLKTFEQPVHLEHPQAAVLPRTYIYCTAKASTGLAAAVTGHGAAVAKAAGWRYRELPTGHEPEQTMPQAVADLLRELP
jgi:hypothetical protein